MKNTSNRWRDNQTLMVCGVLSTYTFSVLDGVVVDCHKFHERFLNMPADYVIRFFKERQSAREVVLFENNNNGQPMVTVKFIFR